MNKKRESKPTIENLTEPKFKTRLVAHYFVRFHMLLILGAVGISGVLASKILLLTGLHSMLVRYPIAVLSAYAIFFALIRLWLWYVGISPQARDQISTSQSGRSGSSGGGVALEIGSGSRGGSGWSGFGGGSSGGGGASDNWGDAATKVNFLAASNPPPSVGGGSISLGSSSSIGSKGSGGSGFDLDLGDDGFMAIVALILLVAMIAGIFGAGFYLIYQAPAILGEAAFHAALASGLIRASKGIDDEDWKGSVFKATWIPFVLILALSIAFGWAAHRYCPAATKVAEVFTVCK